MAELIAASTALGIASSLITFGDVAWRILKRLDEYCDRSKDVPKVVKNIRLQLQILVEKLEDLKWEEKNGSLVTQSRSTLSKAIESFEEQINLLDEVTTRMIPMKGDSTRVRVKKAGLSIYYEKEMAKIWTQLEAYKTTFIFHFTNMTPNTVLVVEAKLPMTHYCYPASAVSHYVNRETLLTRINDAFSGINETTNARVAVLLGMGGCGKTQLTLQYCRQSEALGRFSSIFWVDVSSPTTTAQSFATIAGIIAGGKADLQDAEASLRTVKLSLGTWTDRWLMVFDNFDDPEAFNDQDIREYFPHGENGSILFTSRHGDVKRLGPTISITEMSQSEGLELLLRQAGCDRNKSNSRIGKEIIARLGNLALAIDQAGAYISTRGLPLYLFKDHYNQRREKVLKETPSTLWEYRRKLSDAEKETSLSVFTTWEMSFEQINRTEVSGKTQEYLLTLSAFFGNRDIFEDLFEKHFISERPDWMNAFDCEGVWDRFEFQNVLAQLAKFSLISSLEITETGSHFSLHPLIQDWIKLRSSHQDCRNKTTEAIKILHGYINTQDVAGFSLKTNKILLSHLAASGQNERSYFNHNDGFESVSLLRAAHDFALFYSDQGRLAEAESSYEQALAGKEKALGWDHTSTLDTVNNLAALYEAQGRLDEAEAMFNRALAGREKMLGQDHLSTLDTIENLGSVYETQGRLNEAEVMYDRVLAGRENLVGQDHMTALETVNNRATLHHIKGQLVAAEAMYKRVLVGKNERLGWDHKSTFTVVNNLAALYQDQGRLDKAEAMYDRALVGTERVLGPDHLSTLNAMHNLATLYHDKGQLKEAEAMYNRVLMGREKVLGQDHMSTLDAINSLASLYEEQGQLGKAEALYDRALTGKEKAVGQYHLSTLDTVNNLAIVYAAQGRLDKAEVMYNHALAGKEKVLGQHHMSTLETVNNLATLYEKQGQLDKAEAMYNQALAGKEKAVGQDHLSTLRTVNNLAGLYQLEGRLDEAEAMFNRALAGKENALGQDHVSTLETVNNLAGLYLVKGRLDEAEALYNRTLVGKEKALGQDHISTLNTVNNLAGLYYVKGRLDEAEAMFNRALVGREKALGQDHTLTLETVNNLATLYEKQGQLDKAGAMYNQALAGNGKAVGQDHLSTLSEYPKDEIDKEAKTLFESI